MRIRSFACNKIDIHKNPYNPKNSRIPVDVCDHNLNEFLKNEIVMTKVCGCPMCNLRRIFLRRLQEIIIENQKYKAKISELEKHTNTLGKHPNI